MNIEIINIATLANLLERGTFKRTDLDGGLSLYTAKLDGHDVAVSCGGGNDALLFCSEDAAGHVLNTISRPLPHLRLV